MSARACIRARPARMRAGRERLAGAGIQRLAASADATRFRCRSGQMTVELAVLIPVMIVVALIVYNLARYTEACAVFDRACLDSVIAQGVAPSGDQNEVVAVQEVQAGLERALAASFPGGSCSVDVTAESLGDARATPGQIGFPVSPLLTRFTCTLRYRPWPGSFSMAGVAMGAPGELSHQRSFVVDRYRPGVLV